MNKFTSTFLLGAVLTLTLLLSSTSGTLPNIVNSFPFTVVSHGTFNPVLSGVMPSGKYYAYFGKKISSTCSTKAVSALTPEDCLRGCILNGDNSYSFQSTNSTTSCLTSTCLITPEASTAPGTTTYIKF